MKRRFLKYCVFLFFAIIPFILFAQPGGPGGDPPPNGAPLDGGLLSVLVGSGIAYLGFLRRKKKKKDSQ